MQRNVDLNFPQHTGTSTCPVKVAELDWGGDLPDDLPHNPEIILAADCVYFEVSGALHMTLSVVAELCHS